MDAHPRYTIRGLLTLTLLVVIACLTLVMPSPWWIVPLPVIAAIAAVYAIQQWQGKPILPASLLCGVAAYAVTVLFVQQIFRSGDERDVWVVPGDLRLGADSWGTALREI